MLVLAHLDGGDVKKPRSARPRAVSDGHKRQILGNPLVAVWLAFAMSNIDHTVKILNACP